MDKAATPESIGRAIRARFRNLPAETNRRQERTEEEKREAYNRRLREYMPQYRGRRSRHTVTLHPDEDARLRREVRIFGYRPATLLRRAAFANFDGKCVIPKDMNNRLSDIIVQIQRIGNNINQIAHHANLKKAASARDLSRCRQLLEELHAVVCRTLERPADDTGPGQATGPELPA